MSDESNITWGLLGLFSLFALWCLWQALKEPKKNKRHPDVLPPPSRNCQRAYPDV